MHTGQERERAERREGGREGGREVLSKFLLTPIHHNSTFTANGQLNQSAAVFAFRFPISLQGTVVFIANKGGGIALLQTRADAIGTILFEKNEALAGAGIAMQEQSLV